MHVLAFYDVMKVNKVLLKIDQFTVFYKQHISGKCMHNTVYCIALETHND